MDIRSTKTKNSIINAFLELRSKRDIEKITVKELCEKAMINKSTFYTYFRDVYDLSEYLENEIAEEIIAGMNHPEAIVTNPKEFNRELFEGYFAHENLIRILFSGSRSSFLSARIEENLQKVIYEMYPEARENVLDNIMLIYNIYGSFYAFQKCRKYGEEVVVETLSEFLEKTHELL